MADNKINTVLTAEDKASAKINTLRQNITKLGNNKSGALGGMASGFAASAVAGLGAAAMFGALTDGLKSAGEFLGDAANKAIDDQKSILSLNQALKDNVPAWDGSTAAIDRATQAGLDLGFADDVSREALQKLVIATGDVEQSTSDLALAFDIARGTGKSLTDVAGDLARIEAGSFKSLKQYGIEVSKGMTVTEALGELQKRFAGQAATYTDTLAGKLEVTNTKFDEMQETIGYQVLPVIEDAVTWFDHLADSLGNVGKDMAGFTGGFSKDMGTLTHAVEDVGTTAGADLAESLLSEYKSKMAAAKAVFQHSAQAIDADLAGAIRGNKDMVKSAMDTVMWAIKHPMALTRQVAKIEGALTTLEYKRGLASNTAEVNTVIDQQMALLRAQWSNLTGKAYGAGAAAGDAWTNGYRNNISAPGQARDAYVNRVRKHGDTQVQAHASGGWMPPGETSVVGERGPEIITAGRGGMQVTANGAGGHGHDIYMDGRLVGRLMDERNGKSLAMSSNSPYTRT